MTIADTYATYYNEFASAASDAGRFEWQQKRPELPADLTLNGYAA